MRGVMEVDFLPHENETGEKEPFLMPTPPLLPPSSAKALSELRSLSAPSAAKTLPIVDVSEYITRWLLRWEEEEEK